MYDQTAGAPFLSADVPLSSSAPSSDGPRSCLWSFFYSVQEAKMSHGATPQGAVRAGKKQVRETE